MVLARGDTVQIDDTTDETGILSVLLSNRNLLVYPGTTDATGETGMIGGTGKKGETIETRQRMGKTGTRKRGMLTTGGEQMIEEMTGRTMIGIGTVEWIEGEGTDGGIESDHGRQQNGTLKTMVSLYSY